MPAVQQDRRQQQGSRQEQGRRQQAREQPQLLQRTQAQHQHQQRHVPAAARCQVRAASSSAAPAGLRITATKPASSSIGVRTKQSARQRGGGRLKQRLEACCCEASLFIPSTCRTQQMKVCKTTCWETESMALDG